MIPGTGKKKALLRAVEFLYDISWIADGDDLWQIWLINYSYETGFPTETAVSPGKNMGWTDWSHRVQGPIHPMFLPAIIGEAANLSQAPALVPWIFP